MKQSENERLRNFMIDDDLYYDLEFIAQKSKRNTKDQLVFLMQQAVDQYKRDNALKKVPRTDKRLEKIKAGKK